MKLALLDGLERKEPVDQEHSDVESLWHQPELSMHVDDPLYKEGS